MTTEERAFSKSEALRFGWEKTKANLRPLLGIGAVGGFLGLLNQALTRPPQSYGASALLALVVQVLQVGVMLAYVRVALRICDGKDAGLGTPAALLVGFFTFLLMHVLYVLIVAVGMVLLVVPGVIWGLKYAYAGFLVADKGLDPFEALRESGRLTQGVKGELLLFALVAFGVNIIGALALGVGLFVTLPTTFIAAAYIFRRLQARASQAAPSLEQRPLAPPPAPVAP